MGFSKHFKSMAFLRKYTTLQKHHLPPTAISPASLISPNIIRNYLGITLASFPKPVTNTSKFAGPICKPVNQCQLSTHVYHPTTLFMLPLFPQCRDLGSEVLPSHLNSCHCTTSKIHSSITVAKYVLILSLYLKTHHLTYKNLMVNLTLPRLEALPLRWRLGTLLMHQQNITNRKHIQYYLFCY